MTVLTHPDPLVCRLLLMGQAEMAEAKALRNLRLHERRLQRLYERHEAELETLRRERFQEEEEARRAEEARKRAERRKAREEAAALNNGFEFSTLPETPCIQLQPPANPSSS